jgi:hypothetical protein
MLKKPWTAFSTKYYLSNRIGRDVPAQEATARQALTTTLRHKLINAAPFESTTDFIIGSRHS